MLAYLNRLIMPSVCNRTLPEDIQRRLRALNRAGFKTVVKDLTLDLAPVAFVFAQNQRLTFTTCAGCCDFNYAIALDHALMEVEAAAYCRLVNSSAKPINPDWFVLPMNTELSMNNLDILGGLIFLVTRQEKLIFRLLPIGG